MNRIYFELTKNSGLADIFCLLFVISDDMIDFNKINPFTHDFLIKNIFLNIIN